ncbi:MAG: peptide chain release factor 2 [Chloroflexi bacterium]|nr:peptide chain release factor 2 [Chloroflexota bacterium]
MARLETETYKPDLWQDQEKAQALMRELSTLKEQVETWRGLQRKLTELRELAALSADEAEPSLLPEIRTEVDAARERLERLEFELVLSGDYDSRNAILAIHAGAGGTESQDWAEMLLRMYLRWAERKGFGSEVLDVSPGEEAGIKSSTVEITGPYAYGYLKGEHGVHRLVRISPFDASHSRHTSFVLVEVLPEAEEATDVTINPDDLRIDVFRSSGAGGQNVQKNATAVRITHLPTGLVVTCQNERSQLQNKETAMKVLRARLMELELEKKAEEQARLKGQRIDAGWGNQIRSYVLHPYKLVKDHRSAYESSAVNEVLDGELDALLKAYLNTTVGESV